MISMIQMDSKGQGFDVFKLLIAAVVAATILVILLQTLNIIPKLGDQDPTKVASNEIKNRLTQLSTPIIIKDVKFTRGSSLNASAIARASGSLAPDQVCVKTSETTPNRTNFSENNGKVVEYFGGNDQSVGLVAICDTYSELETSLDDYSSYQKYQIGGLNDCFETDPNDFTKVCLVAVIPDQ